MCPACLDALAPPGSHPGAGPGDDESLDGVTSLFAFEGSGRQLVVALKYRNGRALGLPLGAAMAGLVEPATVDVVTWAPTSAARRHRRGFDQSRLLAGAVAATLHRPCWRLLRRGPGPPQTGTSALERRLGPRFEVVGPVPARVLVVDDVVTTGATLAAAARALRGRGATRVMALTAAATPRRHPVSTGPTGPAGPTEKPQGRRRVGRE